MEVNKAIEIINGMYRRIIGEWAHSDKEEEDIRKGLDDIISLLQQGEAYRQMWEELDDFIGYSDYDILQKMKDIKQKYLPKEASQDYPEGDE